LEKPTQKEDCSINLPINEPFQFILQAIEEDKTSLLNKKNHSKCQACIIILNNNTLYFCGIAEFTKHFYIHYIIYQYLKKEEKFKARKGITISVAWINDSEFLE
jgi:hypothetical protein